MVMEATHSAQLPGTEVGGTVSGGNREVITILAKAAVASGYLPLIRNFFRIKSPLKQFVEFGSCVDRPHRRSSMG